MQAGVLLDALHNYAINFFHHKPVTAQLQSYPLIYHHQDSCKNAGFLSSYKLSFNVKKKKPTPKFKPAEYEPWRKEGLVPPSLTQSSHLSYMRWKSVSDFNHRFQLLIYLFYNFSLGDSWNKKVSLSKWGVLMRDSRWCLPDFV